MNRLSHNLIRQISRSYALDILIRACNLLKNDMYKTRIESIYKNAVRYTIKPNERTLSRSNPCTRSTQKKNRNCEIVIKIKN